MLSSAVNSNLRNVDAKKEECINQLRIDYFLQKASFLRPSVLVDEVFAKLPEKLIPGIFLAALLAEYSAAQPRSRIWLHNFVNADLEGHFAEHLHVDKLRKQCKICRRCSRA